MGSESKRKPKTVHLLVVAITAAAVALGSQFAVEQLVRYLSADQHPDNSHPSLRHGSRNGTQTAGRRLESGIVQQWLKRESLSTPCGPQGLVPSTLSCVWMPSVAGQQCCCRYKQIKDKPKLPEGSMGYRFGCLPNAVVIGAQKSGSSALFSHLLRYPGAVPFMGKEAHYFDRDSTFENGIRHYLSTALDPLKILHSQRSGTYGKDSLVDLHTSEPPQTLLQEAGLTANYQGFEQSEVLQKYLADTFTLETTPAYVLDTRGAVKMATLVPHAKLLLILRNPVDRAYSEWNMKLRRVQAQFDASDLEQLQRVYHGIIKPCFLHPSREVKYNASAPAAAGSTKGAQAAARQNSDAAARQNSDAERKPGIAVYRCLLKHLPLESSLASLLRPGGALRSAVAPCLVKGTDSPWAKRKRTARVPDYRNEPPRAFPMPRDAGSQYSERLAQLRKALPLAVQEVMGGGGARTRALGAQPQLEASPPHVHPGRQMMATRLLGNVLHSVHWVVRRLGAAALQLIPGGSKQATQRHPWAAPVGSIPGLPAREVEDDSPAAAAAGLKRELARLPDSTSLPPLDMARRCLSPPLVRPETVPPVTSLGQEAATIKAHCQRADGTVRWGERGCWPNGLTSNIVSEFVARGLYLPQLQLFHAVFGMDRVMVLSDSELLDDAKRPDTLKRVFGFLGLPELAADALLQASNASSTQALFSSLFPSFERTGWRAKSHYSPLPAGLREQLAQLFAPINKQLYAYLGRDLGWETAT